MKYFLTTRIGWLRLLGVLEGTSLLLLVFVAVPVKYLLDNPLLTKVIGPIHGVLFLLFVVSVFIVAIHRKWYFSAITWKVLIACLIPFGTFYIDHAILRHLPAEVASDK